jgi:hypothetical protein
MSLSEKSKIWMDSYRLIRGTGREARIPEEFLNGGRKPEASCKSNQQIVLYRKKILLGQWGHRAMGSCRFADAQKITLAKSKYESASLQGLTRLLSLKSNLLPVSEASRNIVEYLDLDVIRINFRGQKRAQNESTEWCVQITFSGCAGMAETSASLAAHWAELWYLENRTELQKEIFSLSGFYSSEPEDNTETETFLPLPEGGYAKYFAEPQEMYINGEELSFHFEIDDSFLEAQADGGLDLMNKIESEYLTVMANGKCRCQLCI